MSGCVPIITCREARSPSCNPGPSRATLAVRHRTGFALPFTPLASARRTGRSHVCQRVMPRTGAAASGEPDAPVIHSSSFWGELLKLFLTGEVLQQSLLGGPGREKVTWRDLAPAQMARGAEPHSGTVRQGLGMPDLDAASDDVL